MNLASAKAVALACLALVTLAGCVATTAPDPSPSRSDRTLLSVPKRAHMYVMGDSWSAGFAADPNKTAPVVAAQAMGWTYEINAISGTGYSRVFTKGTFTYKQRAEAVSPGTPGDVVLLQGSTNDEGATRRSLESAVRETLAVVRARFPSAAVVMLGPGLYATQDAKRVATLDEWLRAEASHEQVAYLSMITEHWITSSNISFVIDPSTLHPTVDGDAYLGGRLVADLRSLGAR